MIIADNDDDGDVADDADDTNSSPLLYTRLE
jgi:hypothetical protein